MAQYPTSVPSFSNKSAGETIQPAHINGLQDEIVALAGGLKNGLDHSLTVSTGGLTVSTGSVNLGGPSSVTTLQVNGASTFAGAVTFSTTVTFNAPMLPTVPYVVLTHSGNQPVANASETALNWDTAIADASDMHSTVTNSSRITFAASTGVYEVGLQVTWAQASTGSQTLRIRQNDSSGVLRNVAYLPTAGSLSDQLTGLVRAAATTDYVTAHVLQFSGSTKSVEASTEASLRFWARLVSR